MIFQKRSITFVILAAIAIITQYLVDRYSLIAIIEINTESGLDHTHPTGIVILLSNLILGYIIYSLISYREFKVSSVSISKFFIYLSWSIIFMQYLITKVADLYFFEDDLNFFAEDFFLWCFFFSKGVLLVCFYLEHFLRISLLAFKKKPTILELKIKLHYITLLPALKAKI